MLQIEQDRAETAEQVAEQFDVEPVVADIMLAEVDHHLVQLENWYEKWQKLKDRKGADLTRGQQKYAAMLQELERSEGEKLKLETTLHNEIHYRDQSGTRMDKVRQRLDVLIEDVDCLSDVIQQYDLGKEAVEKNNASRQEKQKQLLFWYESAKKDLVKLEKHHKNKARQKEESLVSLAAAEADLRLELETRRNFLSRLEMDLARLNEEQKKQESDNTDKADDIGQAKSSLLELQVQLECCKSALSLAEKEAEGISSELQETKTVLQLRRVEYEQQLCNLMAKESKLSALRSNWEETILSKQKVVEDLETAGKSCQTRLDAWEVERVRLKGTLAELQLEYGKKDVHIAELKDQLQLLQNANENFREKHLTAQDQLRCIGDARDSFEKASQEKKNEILETVSKEKSLLESARNKKDFLAKLCSLKREEVSSLQTRVQEQNAANELEQQRLSQQEITTIMLSPPPTQQAEQPAQSKPGQPTFLQPRPPAAGKVMHPRPGPVVPRKRALSMSSNESEYVDLPTSVIMSEDSVRGDDSPKRIREAANTQEFYSDRATAASSTMKARMNRKISEELNRKGMAPPKVPARGRRGGLNRGNRHGRLEFL
ncbi:myosin-13-like isoform X1 [Paramacrobiotus metropolitanus]|uniref:myosin-13-like isoform X1 n=1 Tax=Paramacrobiotus metropolitanus TaxID=2943436 RepID=UPI002445AE41|nr:myosin-13-like isoform X1 [Paramacrobiotus metropolitanus]